MTTKPTIIPLKDVLFVFDSWTLMAEAEGCPAIKVGDLLHLLNSSHQEIGKANVVRFLPSRNPAITPIVIQPTQDLCDPKQAKYACVSTAN